MMSSDLPLLTADTASAYVAALPGVLPAAITAVEIGGGNLNFAYQVSDGAGASVFLKQTPGFVKVLGPEAKISNQRLVVERQAYAEWASAIGADAAAAACLPAVHHFDSERMVMVMEFLGSSVLLHERLVSGHTDEGVPAALGAFLGAAHAATHSALVPAERAAALSEAFANDELRGLQLEYVFSKCYREAERAAALRDDAPFMTAVEQLKAAYRGETPTNLALCHGDFHAGSVMVSAPAAGGGAGGGAGGAAVAPSVKVIDPEFAIYGPPGVDVGCLLSSYVLAAVYCAVEGTAAEARALRAAAAAVWEAYAASMSSRGVPAAVLDAIGADAAGFTGCEVARTALGFAGVRGLPISDAELKEKAEASALGVAERCIKGRASGIAAVLGELDALVA